MKSLSYKKTNRYHMNSNRYQKDEKSLSCGPVMWRSKSLLMKFEIITKSLLYEIKIVTNEIYES